MAAGALGVLFLAPDEGPAASVENIQPLTVISKKGKINEKLVEQKEKEMRLMREEMRLMRAENEVNEQRRREGKAPLELKAGLDNGGSWFG